MDVDIRASASMGFRWRDFADAVPLTQPRHELQSVVNRFDYEYTASGRINSPNSAMVLLRNSVWEDLIRGMLLEHVEKFRYPPALVWE